VSSERTLGSQLPDEYYFGICHSAWDRPGEQALRVVKDKVRVDSRCIMVEAVNSIKFERDRTWLAPVIGISVGDLPACFLPPQWVRGLSYRADYAFSSNHHAILRLYLLKFE
jgi:hypothetical protein